MTPMRFVKVILFFACLALASLVNADIVLDEMALNGAVPLAISTSFLEDEDGSLKYSDISTMKNQFSPLKKETPNFGFTKSTYWFRTVVTNSLTDSTGWLLEIAYPLLDDIVVYEKSQDDKLIIHQAGDLQPFKSREIDNRNFLFRLSLETNNPVELIIRVSSSSSMLVPIKIWSFDSYAISSHTEYFLLGLYYGTMAALFAYNLMLIFWIRDSVYVYYAGYLAFYSIFQLSLNGLAFKFLWPESVWLAERSVLLFLCLAAIFVCKFSHSLLQINKFSSMLDKAYLFTISFFVAMIPFSIFADYQAVIKLLSVVVVAACLLLLFSGYQSLCSGVSTAKYYLMAFCVFLIGIAIYAMKSLGLIAARNISEYAIMVASTIDAILLSFALSHRFKVLKDENNRMQTEAQETLEQSVAERTKELKSVLDELSVANTQLEELNNTDTLTGVRSRAYFDEHAEFVWKNADRSDEELAIMMLDVDNFKHINDNYGHLIGDEVLISVAQAINTSLTRSTDQMARYGGEEFIVILPAAELAGTLIIAEKIRATVENIDTQSVGLSQSVTISIGVTLEHPSSSNVTLRDAIEHADKALYQAKHNGKNCVIVYNHDALNASSSNTLHVSGMGGIA